MVEHSWIKHYVTPTPNVVALCSCGDTRVFPQMTDWPKCERAILAEQLLARKHQRAYQSGRTPRP